VPDADLTTDFVEKPGRGRRRGWFHLCILTPQKTSRY
jgi:hypothetical protein